MSLGWNRYDVGMIAAIIAGMILIVIFIIPWSLTIGQVDTGICLYRGAPTYDLFSSSTGVPIRGIDVVAWHNDAFGKPFTIAEGATDRLGCFTFKANSGGDYFLTFTYNGTRYTDPVKGGMILGDNF